MACKQELIFSFLQFKVGDPGSFYSPNLLPEEVNIPSDGDISFNILVPGGINATVLLYKDGYGPLLRNITDDSQVSYGCVVNAGDIQINLYNGTAGFQQDNWYIVTFSYLKIIS